MTKQLTFLLHEKTGVGGLAFLQFCQLNSFRNKFILAVPTFLGFSVAQYFNEYTAIKGYGPTHTSARWVKILSNLYKNLILIKVQFS